MSWLGIVGAEGRKFDRPAEGRAKHAILDAIKRYGATGIVSGACHLGGIDVWAIAAGRHLDFPEDRLIEYPPAHQRWTPNGYKLRNEKIAMKCDACICIAVRDLPHTFRGMSFDQCYHCEKIDPKHRKHFKSGGCWTMHYAASLGKPVELIII